MAVDNPPHPAQPAIQPRLATLKDVALIVSGLGGFLAVLVAAVALFASLTIAPVRDEMRLMRDEIKSGFEAVDADFDAVDAEFKAIRKDLADLSERLTRLETLLEQGAGQGQAPETPDTE